MTHKSQHPDYKYQPRRKKSKKFGKHGKHCCDDECDESTSPPPPPKPRVKKSGTAANKSKTSNQSKVTASVMNGGYDYINQQPIVKVGQTSDLLTPSSSTSSVEQYPGYSRDNATKMNQNELVSRYYGVVPCEMESPCSPQSPSGASMHSSTEGQPLTPPTTPYTGLTNVKSFSPHSRLSSNDSPVGYFTRNDYINGTATDYRTSEQWSYAANSLSSTSAFTAQPSSKDFYRSFPNQVHQLHDSGSGASYHLAPSSVSLQSTLSSSPIPTLPPDYSSLTSMPNQSYLISPLDQDQVDIEQYLDSQAVVKRSLTDSLLHHHSQQQSSPSHQAGPPLDALGSDPSVASMAIDPSGQASSSALYYETAHGSSPSTATTTTTSPQHSHHMAHHLHHPHHPHHHPHHSHHHHPHSMASHLPSYYSSWGTGNYGTNS